MLASACLTVCIVLVILVRYPILARSQSGDHILLQDCVIRVSYSIIVVPMFMVVVRCPSIATGW